MENYIWLFIIIILALIILVPGLIFSEKIKRWTGELNIKLFGQNAEAKFDIENENQAKQSVIKISKSKRTDISKTYEGAKIDVDDSEDSKISETGGKTDS